MTLSAGVRVCPAPSPVVHCGHPALRSLAAGRAFGILPSLAANAGCRGMGNPSLMHQRRKSRITCSRSKSDAAGEEEEEGPMPVRFSPGNFGPRGPTKTGASRTRNAFPFRQQMPCRTPLPGEPQRASGERAGGGSRAKSGGALYGSRNGGVVSTALVSLLITAKESANATKSPPHKGMRRAIRASPTDARRHHSADQRDAHQPPGWSSGTTTGQPGNSSGMPATFFRNRG